MKHLILTFFLLSAFCVYAGGNSYKADDQAIEKMFSQAVETMPDISDVNSLLNLQGQDFLKESEKSAWAAFALCITGFVTGITGLHRLYLGSDAGVFLIYFCTGGGFGILQTVDAIMLFVRAVENDGDVSPYVNSNKLFMW